MRIFRKTNVSTQLHKNGHNFTCDQYFFMKLAPLDSAHIELSIHAKNSIFLKNCKWSIFPQQVTYFTGDNHQHIQMFTNTVHKAIHLGVWGTDLHLFPLSLLLNRPIFTYTTFYRIVDSVRILELSDTLDTHHLAQRFSSRDQGTTGHFVFCSDVLRVTLFSGSIASLPFPPLSMSQSQQTL